MTANLKIDSLCAYHNNSTDNMIQVPYLYHNPGTAGYIKIDRIITRQDGTTETKTVKEFCIENIPDPFRNRWTATYIDNSIETNPVTNIRLKAYACQSGENCVDDKSCTNLTGITSEMSTGIKIIPGAAWKNSHYIPKPPFLKVYSLNNGFRTKWDPVTKNVCDENIYIFGYKVELIELDYNNNFIYKLNKYIDVNTTDITLTADSNGNALKNGMDYMVLIGALRCDNIISEAKNRVCVTPGGPSNPNCPWPSLQFGVN